MPLPRKPNSKNGNCDVTTSTEKCDDEECPFVEFIESMQANPESIPRAADAFKGVLLYDVADHENLIPKSELVSLPLDQATERNGGKRSNDDVEYSDYDVVARIRLTGPCRAELVNYTIMDPDTGTAHYVVEPGGLKIFLERASLHKFLAGSFLLHKNEEQIYRHAIAYYGLQERDIYKTFDAWLGAWKAGLSDPGTYVNTVLAIPVARLGVSGSVSKKARTDKPKARNESPSKTSNVAIDHNKLNKLYGKLKEPIYIKNYETIGYKGIDKPFGKGVIVNPERRVWKPGEKIILDKDKKYIFSINKDGHLVTGVEKNVGQGPNVYIPKSRGSKTDYDLGHPTLNNGKPARFSGEIRYDPKKGWIINGESGRYTNSYSDRTNEMLNNVAALLKSLGLPVKATKYSPITSKFIE